MKKKSQKASNYPEWVCFKCGYEYGKKKCFEVSTYHLGKCDVCHKDYPVTQPRDFGYPDFGELK